MTAHGGSATLASYERRLARARLARQAALLAACLVAVMPPLILASLARSLPAVAIVVAVPAGDDADAVAAELAAHTLTREVARADADRTAELWRTLAATGEPPRLVEAELWPAAAVDATALRRRLEDLAPSAAIEVHSRSRANPGAVFALALGVAVLAALAVWRVRRAVRRVLNGERTTLGLVCRFGATRSWVDAQFARPLRRRVRRGAVGGAVAGAGIGTAIAAAVEPVLFHPWTGAATALVVATAIAFTLTVAGLTRLAAVTTTRRLDRLTGTRP